MLALSVAAMVGSTVLRKRLVARQGGWNAALIAAGAYLIAVIVVARLHLGVNDLADLNAETPDLVADRIRAALAYVPAERLAVAPEPTPASSSMRC